MSYKNASHLQIAKKQGTCRRNPRENTWHDWRLSPLNDYATSTWGFLKGTSTSSDSLSDSMSALIRSQYSWYEITIIYHALESSVWKQQKPRCKSNKFNNPSDLQLPSPKNVNVKIHCVLLSIYQHKSHVIHQLLTIKQWFKKNMVRTCKKIKQSFNALWLKIILLRTTIDRWPSFSSSFSERASALGFLRLSIRPSQSWLKVKTTTTRDNTKIQYINTNP